MKQKFSILLFLLLLWFTGSQAVAQNAPNPFDIEQPSLRVFLPAPELATGRAVVACPGGGYSHLAVDHEGYDWAPYFNKQGIALIVLKYRMPNGDRTLPISDAEAAMKIVRDSADVWNLNPRDIGIMGSSAGGHLASLLGCKNIAECLGYNYESVKLNATILGYPLIDMKTYYENHPNKFGKFGLMVSDMDILDCINPTLYVDGNYPPAFIWNTQEDDLVDCEQSIEFVKKIVEVKGIVEYHMFTYGVHGLSLNNILTNKGNILNNHMKSPNVSKWFEMAIEWLNRVLEVK